MDDGPFRYHLELTPEQLKITHTALRSLLDDFGHDERAIQDIIHSVLDKLPDDHAIRAIRLDHEVVPAPADDDTVVQLKPEPDGDGSAA